MLTGKGWYIWKVRDCEGGQPERIAQVAEDARLSHVLIKIADGAYAYNIAPAGFEHLINPLLKLVGRPIRTSGVDLVPAMAAALHDHDIDPWGWQYVYGQDPVGEAQIAIVSIRALQEDGVPLGGFVVNAENEYKGRPAAARLYMQTLRREFPNLPIALSSYRYPTLHRDFPFDAFLEFCDIVMPQVYWMQAHNSAEQLERSFAEHQDLKYRRLYFPTLAAFQQNGWKPTAGEIQAAMVRAKGMGLPGVNFWEWANTKRYLLDGWEVIRSFAWADTPGQPADPTTEPIGSAYITTVKRVNLRTDPSKNADSLVVLNPGTMLMKSDSTVDTPLIKWQSVRCWVALEENGTKLAE